MAEALTTIPVTRQRELAAEVYGCEFDPRGFGTCPGAHLHSTPTKPGHFKLFFKEGKLPGELCFHGSCAAERDSHLRALWSAIKREEMAKNGDQRPARPAKKPLPATVSPSGSAEKLPEPKPAYIPGFAERYVRGEAAHDPQLAAVLRHFSAHRHAADEWGELCWWLEKMSPVEIPADPAAWPALLLDTLYAPGERIIIFDEFKSQGQWLYEIGRGLYTLSPRPEGHATRCTAGLPRRAPAGLWFLAAPVTGLWLPKEGDQQKLTRRSRANCTTFRYAVLESDTVDPVSWVKFLFAIAAPIAAIYTSGGKSIHTLLRVDAATHEQFRTIERGLKTLYVPAGADPAAITSVRLTRLPGCIRGEKEAALGPAALQRLLYLDPKARKTPPFFKRHLWR